jgi:dephospho-CoA kinase
MVNSSLLGKAPRVVGLTGGIGTGKTTASNYLAHHYRLTILDADLYAREAISRGSEGLQAVVARYGTEILQGDDALNRSRLAQIMFENPREKQWIESLIHPYVRHRLEEMQALRTGQSPMVMVIPLLFEAGMTDLVSEVWVIFCRPEQQLNRLMQRSHLSRQDAQLRIDSQMPMTEKCAHADVVLDNSGSTVALYAQIDRALQGCS